MQTSFNWSEGSLAEGLRCYRTQQFFEAHEHWESIWLTLHEPEKSFLQSLIQVSAAFHHLRRGNRRGAISLLSRALHRLNACPSEYCRLDIASLRDQAREWLTAIQSDPEQEPPNTFPDFRTTEP
jgi:uncharacterized protein